MATIENEHLRVEISELGAQLTSVYNKADQTEHLWQGDPEIWPWHAPNLFPTIGESLDKQLHVDGKAYPMNRHGFARESVFKLIESKGTHAKFSLPYSKDTLAVYPYKFEFQIIYDLVGNALRICYKVINHDTKTIYFSVGGHPAFRVPFYEGEAYEDYYLEFEHEETMIRHMIDGPGFFTGETATVPTYGNKLRLTKELFALDALVFKNLKSREVKIKSDKHNHCLSVKFLHFNYLGIWAKHGAPFVCIEPWLGCADTVDKVTDIKDREDIQKVEYGHVFEMEYYISLSK